MPSPDHRVPTTRAAVQNRAAARVQGLLSLPPAIRGSVFLASLVPALHYAASVCGDTSVGAGVTDAGLDVDAGAVTAPAGTWVGVVGVRAETGVGVETGGLVAAGR